MPAREHSQISAIENYMIRFRSPSGALHEVSGMRKIGVRFRRLIAFQFTIRMPSVGSEHPQRLSAERTRDMFEVRIAIQDRTETETVAEGMIIALDQCERPPAI